MTGILTIRGRKLASILIVPAWRQALRRYRVAAGSEHATVLRQFEDCRSVVDIGANRGQFSLVARQCFPNARIDAFEPLQSPANVYRRVFANDKSVMLHECAIGDVPGDAEMHVSAKDDSSSLLPITNIQTQTFPGTGEINRTKVSVKYLSDILHAEDITAPALLKLDVQGFELNALKGSESLLPYFIYVYCECSFLEMYRGQALADEVIAWLHERGFFLRGVFNVAYDRDGKAVQADFLFKKQ